MPVHSSQQAAVPAVWRCGCGRTGPAPGLEAGELVGVQWSAVQRGGPRTVLGGHQPCTPQALQSEQPGQWSRQEPRCALLPLKVPSSSFLPSCFHHSVLPFFHPFFIPSSFLPSLSLFLKLPELLQPTSHQLSSSQREALSKQLQQQLVDQPRLHVNLYDVCEM